MKIQRLHLSIDKQALNTIDSSYDYTDVIVELSTQKKFIASFFSYKSIEQLKLHHQKTGEYLSGKYFQANNMVLVENCSKENVITIIRELIEEGEFNQIFQEL